MGRQIAIITAWQDELAILHKVAELTGGDIRVFRNGCGESRQSLWIDEWRTTPIREADYRIWPTAFPWRPRYRQIKPPCVPDVKDQWVLANVGVAPVIEFSRHLHGTDTAGRLHWSKDFTATEPLAYDVAAFDRLIDGLWRWVRASGYSSGREPFRPFVMPYARRRVDGKSAR